MNKEMTNGCMIILKNMKYLCTFSIKLRTHCTISQLNILASAKAQRKLKLWVLENKSFSILETFVSSEYVIIIFNI